MKTWQRIVLGTAALGVAALVLVGVLFADKLLTAIGGEDLLVYYLSPTQVVEKGDTVVGTTFRLGGMVKPGLEEGWRNQLPLTFEVTDYKNTVTVTTSAAPPEMFREEMGVVLEGELGADGVFHADRVMIKHNNEYRVPEHGEQAPATLIDS